MPKTVNILGLYRAELQNANINKAEDLSGEIWSISDWYRSYPWLPRIDRLYLLHHLQQTIDYAQRHPEHDRYPGDWKKHIEDSGAVISVDDWKWDEYLENEVEIFQYEALKNKYNHKFSCTADAMIIDAVNKGYEKINLYGLYMIGSEHCIYIQGILDAIEIARGHGVEISSQYEDEWLKIDTIHDYKDYIEACRNA